MKVYQEVRFSENILTDLVQKTLIDKTLLFILSSIVPPDYAELVDLVGTIKSYSTNLSCSILSFWCMPKFYEVTQPSTPMPKFDPHYACTQVNHINQASKLLKLFRRLLDPHYACSQANHINQASKLLTLFRRLLLN